MPADPGDARRDDGPHILPLDPPEGAPNLLDTLRRGKWVLAACVAVSAVLGVIHAAGGVPIYRASSRVLLLPRGRYLALRGTTGM